jgi:hypothetical protein
MSETYNMNYQSGMNLGLSGRYCVQVVDSNTNEIISDYGWHKNLILNTGMDGIASHVLSSVSSVGICGTGSRPNYITSSIQTITQSGNFIGLVDYSYFTSFTQSLIGANNTMSYSSIVVPGDLIVDQDFSQSVVTLVSGSILYVSGSGQTFSTPKTFTIWKTSQTRFHGESKRSITYLIGFNDTSSWNCGSVISGSTVTMRRTYTFAAEVSSQSYAEVGCSWDSTANGAVFSRVVLPQTISLSPAQQLRLIYDLVVSYNYNGPVTKSINISGWPVFPSTTTSGTESMENFLPPTVNSNGLASGVGPFTDGLYALDPSSINVVNSVGHLSPFYIFASTVSASVFTGSIGFGTAAASRPGDYGNTGIAVSYITGTYTLVKSAYLTIYQATSSNIMTIGFGMDYTLGGSEPVAPYDQNGQCMIFVFDQPQTKTSLQTLTLGWRWSWSRVLQ